jgi:integrase
LCRVSLGEAKATCSFQVYALLMTALRAGLRRGELVALKWGDFQFGADNEDPNRYILVQRSYDHRWARAFTSTKSKKPRRVDMGRELRRVLLELRDERLIKAFTEGRESITDELVFPSEAGTPLEINNFVARVFEPLLEKAGLRRIRFHDLRHTYGSLLIQGGASLAYVQRMMGHASIQTTVDIYVHLLPGGDIDFSDRLDSLTSKRQNATPAQLELIEAEEEMAEVVSNDWLGGRDSNPDTQIQSLQSYR